MRLDPRELLRTRKDNGESAADPLGGTRRDRMQRLQVGLFGLGTMVMLVGLANIILTSAQQTQADAVPEAAPTVATEDVPPPPARDPLADAGVVPELPKDAEPTGRSAIQELDNPPPPPID